MIDMDIWVKVMEHIAREKYLGKIKDGDVTDEYIQKVKERLQKPAKKSFFKRFLNWL